MLQTTQTAAAQTPDDITRQAAARMLEALADGPVALAIRKLGENRLYEVAGKLTTIHRELLDLSAETGGIP